MAGMSHAPLSSAALVSVVLLVIIIIITTLASYKFISQGNIILNEQLFTVQSKDGRARQEHCYS